MTPCGLILFAWWAALQGDAAVAPINDGLAFDTPATQQADGVFLPPETSMRWTGWGTAAPDEFEIEIHLDPVAYESVGLVVADSSCEAEPLSIHPRETGSVIPPRRIGLEVRGEYWMYREDGRPVRRMRPGGSDLDCLVLSSTTSALRVRSLKVGPIDGEPTQFVKLSTRRPPAPRLALFIGLLVALGLVLTALEERVAAASRFSIEPSARRWQHLHALPMIAAAGAYLGTGHGSVAVPIAFAWWVVARLVFVFRYGPWDRGSLANARTHAVAFALAGAAVLIVSKNVPADPAIRGVSLPFLFGAAILWGALSTPWGKEPARGYLRLLATCVDIGAIALAPAAWAEGNARSILVLFGLTAPVVAFMAALSSRAKTHRLYGPAMLLLAVALVGCVEGALRLGAWSERLRPMRLSGQFEENDLLFWTPARYQSDDGMQPGQVYDVPRIAFRSGPIPQAKPEGEFRVAVLGGSNTWGDGIDSADQVFPQVMERTLNAASCGPEFRVINAGVPGYSSLQLYVLLKHYLLDYHPDLAVFYMLRNDLVQNYGVYTLRELYQQTLARQGSFGARLQKTLRPLRLYNAMVLAATDAREEIAAATGAKMHLKPAKPDADWAANLDDIAALCREEHLVCAWAVEYQSADKALGFEYRETDLERIFAKKAAEHDVPLLDVNRVLYTSWEGDPLYQADDTVHLNVAGHEKVGGMISDFLIERGLVPASGPSHPCPTKQP